MDVHQFYDEGLAHASYAIRNNGQIALIDPGRNPQEYLEFAKHHGAKITTVIETHPHADFVSSHLELRQMTGATIYTSALVDAEYPHQPFDDGDRVALGDAWLEAINTPGHSPDGICILLLDSQNKPHAVFTGDTLFVGDVGRPDLRERVGNVTEKAAELARQLYRSTREKLMRLPADVVVYPAHGPGSLCGKNMGDARHSTIGDEISTNYALQPMDEDAFVALIGEQQPFIPSYFEYDVMLNKKGAPAFRTSIEAIPTLTSLSALDTGVLVVDGRPQMSFQSGHLPGAFNIPDGLRFETWLGSIVQPDEAFYLVAGDDHQLQGLVEKAAKIGYEQLVAATAIVTDGNVKAAPFDAAHFAKNQSAYTIVDIRNREEVASNPVFDNSISIPLPELRAQAAQLPTDKPLVVHCAGGYRSAIGASIVAAALPDAIVIDMGVRIHEFNPVG
ncbi:MBL fold metallo-hydrolase [Parapedobacter sp. 10938]|uniref:MBL fold metallo-hydrolase n=1 Tax=Parapedobacter flavus TaxID=3110225 RepID=UPI002DBDC15E|nr:MBL fold metallo-hydrolase [Parapedobacter sp. 10938]MEC3880894.1 MBL fold metallo-hydrolase [Parapedobacter sp. 10938]